MFSLSLLIVLESVFSSRASGFHPLHTVLASQKIELTNQDSAGGKNFTILTSMYVDRKDIEVGLLISLETALNNHEKGFVTPKTNLRGSVDKITFKLKET